MVDVRLRSQNTEMRVEQLRAVRCAALTAVLAISLGSTASRCPDPKLQEAAIGGHTISGGVVLHKKPLKSANVRLYSPSGQVAWIGKTDKNGHFRSMELNPGDYRVEIRGWGTTTIHLNPEIDKGFMQKPVWELLFVDNACVAYIQIMN